MFATWPQILPMGDAPVDRLNQRLDEINEVRGFPCGAIDISICSLDIFQSAGLTLSDITTVILTMAMLERGFDKKEGDGLSLDRINALLDGYGKAPLVDLTQSLERDKVACCLTFGGSFGTFPETDFLELMNSFQWDEPEEVVLILHREISFTMVWRPTLKRVRTLPD